MTHLSELVNTFPLGYYRAMTKIRNLTGSPYDLAPGVILPAFGEVDADLPDYLVEILTAVPGVEVVTLVPDEDPLDQWRALYRDTTGKDADRRWSEKRLIEEIEKHGAE